jgi:hypothetical protein
MKNILKITAFLLVVAALASCGTGYKSCAAYNKTEIPVEK